jgi:hypothetical protein
LNSQTWCHKDGSLAKHLHPNCSSSESSVQDFQWPISCALVGVYMIRRRSKCMHAWSCWSPTLSMCITCIYRYRFLASISNCVYSCLN